jgi:hypothetical protein
LLCFFDNLSALIETWRTVLVSSCNPVTIIPHSGQHLPTITQKKISVRALSVNCTDLIGHNLSDPKELAVAREKELFKTKCTRYVHDAGEILLKNFINFCGGNPHFVRKLGLRSFGDVDPDDLGRKGLDRAVQVGLLGLLHLHDSLFEPGECFTFVCTLANSPGNLNAAGGKSAAVVGFKDNCVLHDLLYFPGGYTAFVVGKVCR